MHNIEIAQSHLKGINPTDYTISIRLRPGGFCFSLYNRPTRSYSVLYDVNSDNAELSLEQMGLLGEEFQRMNVIDDCEKWTLLPSNIEGTDANAIWELNFGQPPASPLCEADIATAGTRCLYEPGADSVALKSKFPNASLYPIQAADIAYTLQASQRAEKGYMGLDVRDKQMCVYVAEKGRLQLANAYSYETATDLLYFAMNVLHTLQFDQNEMQVELWGKLPDAATPLLKRYIRHIAVASPNDMFDYTGNIKKLANRHEYYDLFNITTICAL